MLPVATLGATGAGAAGGEGVDSARGEKTGFGSGPDPRLRPAAHQFEACLMKEFLEPLQHDALFDDGDGQGGDDSSSALMSFASEGLARAISDRGGFGIAEKLIGQLEKGQAGGGKRAGGG